MGDLQLHFTKARLEASLSQNKGLDGKYDLSECEINILQSLGFYYAGKSSTLILFLLLAMISSSYFHAHFGISLMQNYIKSLYSLS